MPQVLTSRPPSRPLIAYLVAPNTYKARPLYSYQFDYLSPDEQPFRHFYFLFREKLPQSHALEHSYFCRHYDCPFHKPS